MEWHRAEYNLARRIAKLITRTSHAARCVVARNKIIAFPLVFLMKTHGNCAIQIAQLKQIFKVDAQRFSRNLSKVGRKMARYHKI